MHLCEIIQPGLLTTVQDLGRPGWQQLGIPAAGAMDSYALRLGNRLLGNEENAAGLEITMLGPELRFRGDAVMALTGGDLTPRLNDRELPMWETFAIRAGDQLTFGDIRCGCRSYLAVAGGIAVPVVLGSRSTYLRGRLGGVEGRQLQAGDVLWAKRPRRPALPGMRVPDALIPSYGREIAVRVVLGPQDDYFPAQSIDVFLSEPYRVTTKADRMGCRLEGPKISHKGGADIISDGIPPGAVQVPGHGMPIVMLADRQTTGGYAKIATVISGDLPKLAQAKPGDIIRFSRISVAEAWEILRDMEGKLACWQENKACHAYRITVDGNVYTVVVREE